MGVLDLTKNGPVPGKSHIFRMSLARFLACVRIFGAYSGVWFSAYLPLPGSVHGRGPPPPPTIQSCFAVFRCSCPRYRRTPAVPPATPSGRGGASWWATQCSCSRWPLTRWSTAPRGAQRWSTTSTASFCWMSARDPCSQAVSHHGNGNQKFVIT